MTFAYEKWEATGNDFVVVDLSQGEIAARDVEPTLVRQVCDRESGVGADGIVLLEKREGLPLNVEIWNSDGSRAEMCGNALRCVCLLQADKEDHGLTISGRPVKAHRASLGHATVGMGPVGPVGSRALFESIPAFDELLGRQGYLVSFGNPHYVVPCHEIPENWQELGASLQETAHAELGTGGINCGFLKREPREEVRQLCVFERGVGFTKSCGSGACAASAVLEGPLKVGAPHRFELPGGQLEIGRGGGSDFLLSGPARQEFVGRWPQ